ncbi:hypothetical protein FN846DRAFT_887779 [Sphaerosporella brunnea]|uniref:Uncharacterized protein n=1 Tax=Sphaerosporella brunnea TaxID=1250544 RepID=A0A5J5F5F4_9PEZI|nr:hypothetical protein FN846DRAFT_887779 [Sphaerosporella brunnea]
MNRAQYELNVVCADRANRWAITAIIEQIPGARTSRSPGGFCAEFTLEAEIQAGGSIDEGPGDEKARDTAKDSSLGQPEASKDASGVTRLGIYVKTRSFIPNVVSDHENQSGFVFEMMNDEGSRTNIMFIGLVEFTTFLRQVAKGNVGRDDDGNAIIERVWFCRKEKTFASGVEASTMRAAFMYEITASHGMVHIMIMSNHDYRVAFLQRCAKGLVNMDNEFTLQEVWVSEHYFTPEELAFRKSGHLIDDSEDEELWKEVADGENDTKGEDETKGENETKENTTGATKSESSRGTHTSKPTPEKSNKGPKKKANPGGKKQRNQVTQQPGMLTLAKFRGWFSILRLDARITLR